MTTGKRNMFTKQPIAGLHNDLTTQTFKYMRSNIVEQRDYVLRSLSGESISNVEIALATLGDTHAASCFNRLLEIMDGFEYTIECDDELATEFIREQILDRREMIYESLALAKITGVAAVEPIWTDKGYSGMITVKDFLTVDPERIVYELTEDSYIIKPRITTFRKPFEGEEVEATKMIDFRYYATRVNNPYGIGEGALMIDLVNQKRQAVDLWLEIVNKYSVPIKIFTIPSTASAEESAMVYETMTSMQNDTTFIVEEGYKLDIVDLSATGLDKNILPLIEYIDEKISSLILGESITGKELANGAQSRDLVADNITTRKALSLAKGITNRLNETVVHWLMVYNFPGVGCKINVSRPDQLKDDVAVIESLDRIGLNVDKDWLSEKYNVKISESKALGFNFSESEETNEHLLYRVFRNLLSIPFVKRLLR